MTMASSSITLIHGPRERERTGRLLEVLEGLRNPATGRVSALVFAPTEGRAGQLRAALRTAVARHPIADCRLPIEQIADCRSPIFDCPESGLRQIANRKSQIANGVKSQIERAVLYPAVTTFPQFMQRHYAAILGERQFVPDPDRIPLLREILRAQRLPFFESLPDTWGRAATALQALELVQQSLTTGEERGSLIADLAADSPGAAEALSNLDTAYRTFLRERGLADRDTLASELLERWQAEGYRATERALVIDGFAFFFTPLQRAVFAALAPAFESVLVTLAVPGEGLEAMAKHRGFQMATGALEWLRSLRRGTRDEGRGTRDEGTRSQPANQPTSQPANQPTSQPLRRSPPSARRRRFRRRCRNGSSRTHQNACRCLV
jgi:hypothetical protein